VRAELARLAGLAGLAVTLFAVSACGPVTAVQPGVPASRPAPPGGEVSPSPIKRGSYVATARTESVAVRAIPGGKVTRRLSSPTASGAPLVLLVLHRRAGQLEVALPVRPNGSTGWIDSTAVDLAVTPYRLVVSREHHWLDVEYQGRRSAHYPIGVGRAVTPTPPGRYFLTELIRPRDPHGVYGPFAFGLSAFSETLTSFAGGPGQIGLHGTDAPRGLGHDVSHGCLRVSDAVIRHLAATLPLGTPVEIR
jgi:lipoprotein-anchoring transpeptidase ErfK/SrfK